ncbi:precorrin-4 C(11)-methyltransferase [Synechococcus sp. M16CYN]|uniref:precorrin-4 C(11)-methyltransferase n=1 Tax=Synechococcus sp. M16CYN TaxID=3103139 RepID=UPI00324DD75B
MHPISFVGAGPGASDLLTLRAADRLRSADTLVWADSLVCPAITKLVPERCEKIRTSKMTLEEIISVLVDKQRSGQRVVRLHDGDTALYSAINEHICMLTDYNIPVEVVPGISAYQATAAGLATELTIPGVVQTVILGRASGRTGVPNNESLSRLAALKASLCLYLSAHYVEEVQSTLLEYYPVDTPVAVGHRVSWPDELLSVTPLNEMTAFTRKHKLLRTTLYIVSPALVSGPQRSCLYSPNYNHLFRPNL